ncbi:MAG: hypothetical protein V4605_00875, partial [Pseudomonadota bacterium]
FPRSNFAKQMSFAPNTSVCVKNNWDCEAAEAKMPLFVLHPHRWLVMHPWYHRCDLVFGMNLPS